MSSTNPADSARRKAAVLGSPIAHSRSPQLHLAAYRALGLSGWTYDRIECRAEELPALVATLGPEWVGLSVTMPDKFAALAVAEQRTARAERVGSANTLVRTPTGWLADNTDVDGVRGALGSAAGEAVVLGSGGTAPAAVLALAELGVNHITVAARNPDTASRAVAVAADVGVSARQVPLDGPDLGAAARCASVVVSTLPANVAARYAPLLASVPVLLDAIYDPWPTPLAAAVMAAGGTVISGLQMLLHQAFTQVELFTGQLAPREAMAVAIAGSS